MLRNIMDKIKYYFILSYIKINATNFLLLDNLVFIWLLFYNVYDEIDFYKTIIRLNLKLQHIINHYMDNNFSKTLNKFSKTICSDAVYQ